MNLECSVMDSECCVMDLECCVMDSECCLCCFGKCCFTLLCSMCCALQVWCPCGICWGSPAWTVHYQPRGSTGGWTDKT